MAKAATKKSEDAVLQAALARVRAEQGGETPAVEPPAKAKTRAAKAAPKAKAKRAAPAPAAPKASRLTVAPETPEPTATAARATKPAMIAYVPRYEGDSPFTIFFGMKFEANVPRPCTNVEQIRLARQNWWFTVDGKSAPRPVAPPPQDVDDGPRSGIYDPKTGRLMDPKRVEAIEVEATEDMR